MWTPAQIIPGNREQQAPCLHLLTASMFQQRHDQKKPHTYPTQQHSSCTCIAVFSPLPTSSKTSRAQSCLSEPYTSTGLDEFPTYRVLEQHNGFPGLPAEEPVRADWWMAAREPAVEYGTLCLVSTTAEVVGRVYSAGDTLGRKGVEKEQNDFQCLAFTLNPPL